MTLSKTPMLTINQSEGYLDPQTRLPGCSWALGSGQLGSSPAALEWEQLVGKCSQAIGPLQGELQLSGLGSQN
jgi:hypothetical protein